jgi:HK97 family phage major capsid protein
MNMMTSAAAMTAASVPLAREFGKKDGNGGAATLDQRLASALEEVKGFATEFKTKSEAGEKISNDTKEKADRALTDLAGIRAEVTELAQKFDARRPDGEEQGHKSIGQQVGESPELKAFADNGASGTVTLSVKAVTSVAGSGAALIVPDRQAGIVGIPQRKLRIRDLLTPGRTTSNSIEYARQTARTNNAAPVAETTLKPESNYAWEVANAPVRTIAHWVPASRQAMDDIPQLESLIDGDLRYGLDDVEDLQLLLGDGQGQNVYGLYPQATPYSAPITIAGATRIDQLRLAILQVELADYDPDGIVLHPAAWTGIELTKDAAGGYIFANPQGIAGPTLWGRPVVPTKGIGTANFLVGAFKLAAQIFDRMETEVRISDQDRDNFIRNMLTIRAEKRLAMAVKRATAMVRGTLL